MKALPSTIYAIEPTPAPRQVRSDKWKKRPRVLRYRAFRDKVRELRVFLPELCKIVFWMPMPPSWPPSKRLRMVTTPHKAKPDLDNLVKELWDAVHKEDSKVWRVEAEKRWTTDGRGFIEVAQLVEDVKEAA